MRYLHDLFGIRLNIFANVIGVIGGIYSATMLTIYLICVVREENLCSPLNFVCTFNPEEYRSSDNHFILEIIYHAVWLVASVSLLLGNRIKNDLLFLPWLYVVICDMILLAITLTYSIISFVQSLYIIEEDEISRIVLIQLHCIFLKIILSVIFLALIAYIWKGMFSLYMMLPYKEIQINSSCSQDEQENINEDYPVYNLP